MAESKPYSAATPAALGYTMPAEWEPHAATWLGWPHNASDWPGKFEVIPWVYGEMVRKISAGEKIHLLVRHQTGRERRARHIFKHVGVDLRKIKFVTHPTNRGWTRDTGPIFVKKSRKVRSQSRKAGNGHRPFSFQRLGQIRQLAQGHQGSRNRRASCSAKNLFHAECRSGATQNSKLKTQNFVIEGGGIELNGRGTLLSTEECYLHPKIQVRNPGLGKKEIETTLKNYLGVKNIFWLAKGPKGDDTHGHIDDICRFVNAKTLVLVREKNPRDENYRPLAENWERIQDLRLEDGRKPEVVELPMPSPLYFDGVRLPASYANFYICNAAVIVPTFNDPNDRVALGILGELFRDRPVVGIHAVDLVWGFGSLHCLTQQQPA